MNGTGFGQFMADRTPAYEKGIKRSRNQVMSRGGIIRPDKRFAKKKWIGEGTPKK